MSEKILSEFQPITTDEWREVIARDLKGADYERALVRENMDGIRVEPFHRSEHVPSHASGPIWGSKPLILREEIREPNLAEANAHAHRGLSRGAQEITFLNYPIGPSPRNQEGMQELLSGLWERDVAIHWQCGPLSTPVLAMLVSESRWRDVPLEKLRGSVDLDPISDRLAQFSAAGLDTWRDEARRRIADLTALLPGYGLFCVRGGLIEKAGASLAQEIALTLAIFYEYLGVLASEFSGDDLINAVQKCEIRLGVGTSYFFEIAKLRAIRVLLPTILQCFGIAGVMPKIHATATTSNKTLYDPFNNLMRGTIEGMAMVIGGADSITLTAYDQAYHTPDEFSEHLARNTHALMLSEAKLHDVADPMAGGYTVEWLTQAYADKAWEILQNIQDSGGLIASWQDGWLPGELERVRGKRVEAVRQRKRIIVGTTAFGNPQEKRLAHVQATSNAKQVAPHEADLMAMVEAFTNAGSIEQWITDRHVPSTALDPFRVSWPYENIRLRTERAQKVPKILLALFGDAKWRNLRANFVQSLLAAGGYEYQERTVADLAELDLAGFDAVFLCGSDAEYAEAVASREWSIPVWVAGDWPDAPTAVAGCVHAKQPLDITLIRLHDFFEIPKFGPDQEEHS